MAKPRFKRKKPVVKSIKVINQNDSNYSFRTRRSSMRVNLSFVSNVSDSESSFSKRRSNGATAASSSIELSYRRQKNVDELVQTVVKKKKNKSKMRQVCCDTPGESVVCAAAITTTSAAEKDDVNKQQSDAVLQKDTLNVIEEKEQELNKSCSELKDAIMSKTRALFDKENLLAIKTSEILTGNSSGIEEPELDEMRDQRTPSVRVNVSKNEQIVMSGSGKKRNPVEVNAMKRQSPEKEAALSQRSNSDADYVDCNQSIVSTPKKLKISDNLSKSNKSCSKITNTAVRIPVARLFIANNDPNRTTSDLNLVQSFGSQKPNEPSEAETSGNSGKEKNKSLMCGSLNNSASPILSQGKRRSRFSLSLKKKPALTEESFLNRQPLVSSSLIEKQNDGNKNSNTINLDDSKNPSKTINIDDTTKSCMEITTISSHMPIIRRSFQTQIRKSLQLDNLGTTQKDAENNKIPTQPIVESNKNLSKENNSKDSDDCQEDCSVNTVRTSLDVNTSLDRITSADSIAQKENKTPNNSDAPTSRSVSPKDQATNDNATVVQRQSTFVVPIAKPKKSSLNSRKSSLTKPDKHQMQKRSDKTNQFNNDKLSSQRSSSSDQEKENDDKIVQSRQPSTSTIRSSMQVNTSLDSVRKSPVTAKNILDFNKMVTMMEETSSKDNQSKVSAYSSNSQSLGSDSDQENVPLMERLRNISTSKENNEKSSTKRKSNAKRVDSSSKNRNSKTGIENASLHNTRKSLEARRSTRKSVEVGNVSNEASIIESTPYPASRSVLFKTIIKNNIAMNTIDPRKLIDRLDDDNNDKEEDDTNLALQTVIHKKTPKASSSNRSKSIHTRKRSQSPKLLDTVLVDSSEESSSESDQERRQIIIDESVNATKAEDKSKHDKSVKDKSKSDRKSNTNEKNKKSASKRKLYVLRDNSLISFSPADMQEVQDNPAPSKIRRKTKKRKASLTKKPEIVDDKEPLLSPELGQEEEPEPIDIVPARVVKKKKPRKILRKKIVVKKVTNQTMINNMMQNEDEQTNERLSQRDSMREFDLRRLKRKGNTQKHHRIVIVVTGLPRGDKDLVKSVIKALGSAVLEVNVTPRTTHVISTGVRTINLLKGILRGCWLLNLEWALKSLESGKWLDPSPYEMSHFAKAVQENRRDRQLFGKAYVPELFVTCGLIYIENGTSPPAPVLKELVKIAGGRITEDPDSADIDIGSEGLKEIWILDSITTGELQPVDQYKRN